MNSRSYVWACLTCLVLFLAGGCSGGSSGGGNVTGQGTGAASGSLVAGTAWIHGLANVGTESLEGASVSMVVDGQQLPLQTPATVGSGGSFSMRIGPLIPAGSFAVLVTSRSGEVFGTAVARLANTGSTDGKGVFVHVNALTTLCLAYLAKNPGVGVGGARTRVHNFVKIPSQFDMGDELAAYKYSRFHQPKFLSKARAYPGGMVAYLDKVTQVIDVGGTDAGEYVNYNNDEDFGDDVLPQLNNLVDGMQAPAKVADAQTAEAFTAEALAGDSMLDPVVGILFDALSGLSDEIKFTQLSALLTQIEAQLTAIQNMVATLLTQLNADFNQGNYNTLAGDLASPPIANINTGLQCVQNIALSAQPASGPPNLTNLNGYVQNLNGSGVSALGFTLSDVYTYAQTIHDYEMQGASGISSLLTLASQISGADLLLGGPQFTTFQNHVNYYVTQQINAASVINAMSAPVLVGSYPNYTNNFNSSPAFSSNNATNMVAWTQTANRAIVDNVQQEMSVLPYPLLGGTTAIWDISHSNLWYQAATANGASANSIGWVQSLNSNGFTQWSVATTSQIQALYSTASTMNQTPPGSYSAFLNRYGFTLSPGTVSMSQQINTWGSDWEHYGTQTFTTSGYLTIETVQGGYNFGWIDDRGNTGTLGSYQGSDSLASVLSSSRDIFVMNQKNGAVYGGQVTGPMLVVVNVGSSTFASQQPSFAFVPLGSYNGITVQAGGQTADPLSNNSSYTQPLTALPNGTNGAQAFSSRYPITNEVYWTSSQPTLAPISNLVPSTSPAVQPVQISSSAIMSGSSLMNLDAIWANDGDLTTYWQGLNPPPNSLCAYTGIQYYIYNVQVLLNPSASWAPRQQTFSVVGSNDGVTWTTLVPSATYSFAPQPYANANDNAVTIPVNSSAPWSNIALNFTSNDYGGGIGGQVAELRIWGNTQPPGSTVPPPNSVGSIHWLPGSAGKSVTFTASRYLPNGTTTSGNVTLTSPVQANPSNPLPDAIQVWPSVYSVYPADLSNPGLQLYVSRHFGSGLFQDVATGGGTNVTYTSSNPNVTINASGLVTSTVPIPAGTTITVTITDPTVPASTATVTTRPTVTATINVIAQ